MSERNNQSGDHLSSFNWAQYTFENNNNNNFNQYSNDYHPSYAPVTNAPMTGAQYIPSGDYGRTYYNNSRGGKQKASRGGAFNGATAVKQPQYAKKKAEVTKESEVLKGRTAFDIVSNCLDSLAEDISGDMRKKSQQQRKKSTYDAKKNMIVNIAPAEQPAWQDTIQEEEVKEIKVAKKQEIIVEANPWESVGDLFSAKPKPYKKQVPISQKVQDVSKNQDQQKKVEIKDIMQITAEKSQKASFKKPLNNEKETKALIEQSDEYKMWKNIPKAQRERLTSKQMLRVMKPDILAEGLALEVSKPKAMVKKIVTRIDEGDNEIIQPKKPKLNENQHNISQHQPPKVIAKTFKEPQQQEHIHYPAKFNPIQQDGFKLKSKPKKIVVEERNEFNEIVRQIVEKAKKRKVTSLKKAIIKMRDKVLARKERREGLKRQVSLRKQLSNVEEDHLSSGYVTIDELNDDGSRIVKKIPKLNQLAQEAPEPTPHQTYPLKQTLGLPYTCIFHNYEKIFNQIEIELCQRADFQREEQKLNKDKAYVRFREIVDTMDAEDADVDEVSEKRMFLHPKKIIREYVDVIQTPELEQSVFTLVQKLKKLYYNRKMNPNKKGGKMQRNLKKRYIVGMKEVNKHLNAENLKMIIMSINLERVEGDNGLDGMIYDIIQTCRDQKIPLVFCLTRYKLGYVSKFQGQKASILGIYNFQGANEEFSALQIINTELRHSFYHQLSKNLDEYQLKLLRKENRYLDWQLFDKLMDTTNFF